MNKKIAVVSSTDASVVRAVYKSTPREEFDIDLMVADRDCGALEFASKNKIESCLIRSNSNIEFSDALLDVLIENEINYVYLFFTRKIVGQIVSKFSRRIINFHPSLLPACRGLNGFEDSVNSGALLIGSTAHFIDDEIDAGEQIIQTITPSILLDKKKLRHIIFAQQCASLYFIHRLAKFSDLGDQNNFTNINLNQGFVPNIDAESFTLYETLVRME